jgi:hypothetical protein
MGGTLMLTFPFTADAVVNFQMCSFAARSTRTAANWYTRITGIAAFESVDPDWDPGPSWYRGTLTFETPQPVLQPGDTLLEAAVTAGFRQISRDVEANFDDADLDDVDDFGLALDSVEPVLTSAFGGSKPFGYLTFTLNGAYKGDIWMPDVSFTADLLIYRPSLDNLNKPPFHGPGVGTLTSGIFRVSGH